MENKHNYRVSVYLGKLNHARMNSMAQQLGMPIATCVRLIIENGLAMVDVLDRTISEVKKNGNQ